MALREMETYAPDFFDEETLEKIDALGVAAARSIMAADKAAGTQARALYDKADTAINALCDVIRDATGNDNRSPNGKGSAA